MTGNTYTFKETPDGRVEVYDPRGFPCCWLPGAAAEQMLEEYERRRQRDWPVANEWMAGFLLGVHHALAFANQMPEVYVQIERGIASYKMGAPPA